MASPARRLRHIYRWTLTGHTRYRQDGDMIHEMRGQTVTRICFDASIAILTSEDWELRVETSATIKDAEGVPHTFNPESPDSAAAILLVGLNRDVITGAEVDSQGNLLVAFGSGCELTVAPHPDYEAWGLVGAVGRTVCMPGGEVAVWS
ncbi:DUF6188 family protein [Streptomyces sp. NPDC058301]|uniref:DUF6188 family protein n=1 Tax=Streptomyces sp. NPDC058301 TaxID=3346436 RepID=UPI0036E0EC16